MRADWNLVKRSLCNCSTFQIFFNSLIERSTLFSHQMKQVRKHQDMGKSICFIKDMSCQLLHYHHLSEIIKDGRFNTLSYSLHPHLHLQVHLVSGPFRFLVVYKSPHWDTNKLHHLKFRSDQISR